MASKSPCSFFAKGNCTRGAKCPFSHDLAVMAPPKDKVIKQGVCSFFAKGQCTRGESCPFQHIILAPVLTIPAPKQEGICSFFQQGKCTRGESCPFQHIILAPVLSIPAPKQEGICYFFQQGKCTRGESCPFRHITIAPVLRPSHELTATDMSNMNEVMEKMCDNLLDDNISVHSEDYTEYCACKRCEFERMADNCELSEFEYDNFEELLREISDEGCILNLKESSNDVVGLEPHPDLWYPEFRNCSECQGYIHKFPSGCSMCCR